MKRNRRLPKPTREHILDQLWKLAAGRSNDVAKLIFLEPERAEEVIEQMDLSGLAELKRSGTGAVEVKAVDRLRALELLMTLIEETKEGGDDGAASFYDALEASVKGRQEGEQPDPDLLAQAASGADLVV